jgi:hypothetical protein
MLMPTRENFCAGQPLRVCQFAIAQDLVFDAKANSASLCCVLTSQFQGFASVKNFCKPRLLQKKDMRQIAHNLLFTARRFCSLGSPGLGTGALKRSVLAALT